MRANPTQATLNRYFTGAEQDRLERDDLLLLDKSLGG
jgi:hypothetical protein